MLHLTVGVKTLFCISKDNKTATGEISLNRVADYPGLRMIYVHILDTGGMQVQKVDVLPSQGGLKYIPVSLLYTENAWELTIICGWLIKDLFMIVTSEQPVYQS